MRTYNQTHPWISFSIDLNKAQYIHWLLLGEAQSKCKHFERVPLLPSVAKKFYNVYLAKGVIATTAIEGNTLTEEEALQHLEGKLNLPPSKEYLEQEIENIIQACNLIGEKTLHSDSTDITAEEIRSYNRFVLNKLPLDEDVIPGDTRKHNVVVGRYKGAPPQDCEYLIEKLCEWLNTGINCPPEFKMAFGILKAILAHIYIAWIHPFGDGNGRTARLLEFRILLSVGVPATAAHLLSNHYNQTRTEYYRQLDISYKDENNIFSFIEYALRGFIDGLKEQIQIIKNQQMSVHWINYIHAEFQNKNRRTDLRRRRLIIDLSKEEKPIPISEVRHISPRIAEEYANKTQKTIKRDINKLSQMELIVKSEEGIRAKKEIMLAFIPPIRK